MKKKNKIAWAIVIIAIILGLGWYSGVVQDIGRQIGLFAVADLAPAKLICTNGIANCNQAGDLDWQSYAVFDNKDDFIEFTFDRPNMQIDKAFWISKYFIDSEVAKFACWNGDSWKTIGTSYTQGVKTKTYLLPNSCYNTGKIKTKFQFQGTKDLMVYYETKLHIVTPGQQPVCGNGACEYNENIENCCTDCGCEGGLVCENNNCVEPPPECGDFKCDPGENQENCCTDCGCQENFECVNNNCIDFFSHCGNEVCERTENENCNNCPIDCGQCECNTGDILYAECEEGFKENTWPIKQCIFNKWIPVEELENICFCYDNTVCKEDYVCKNHYCEPDNEPFCETSNDCVSGFYCEEESHICLSCPEYYSLFSIFDCELSEVSCYAASDCYQKSSDYCSAWLCEENECIAQEGKRYEGCCEEDYECELGQKCNIESKVCEDIEEEIIEEEPKRGASAGNLIITLLIILIPIIGVIEWKTKFFRKLLKKKR